MARDFEREDATADAREQDAAAPTRTGGARRVGLALAATAALGGGLWFGWGWWSEGRFLVTTDDAYVAADYAILSPKVAGYVAAAPAVENARVAEGAALVRLDPGDYRAALDSAEAALAARRAAAERADREVAAAQAAVAQAEARREAAQADRAQAEADFARYSELARSDFASRQRLDAAQAAQAKAQAAVAEAEAGIDSARAQVAVARAQRDEAAAAVNEAEATVARATRDLDATVLRAPFDGVVGNLSVSKGDYVTPGARLLAVVPLSRVYVEANFKETQIGALAAGTPVRLTSDAYPDRAFTGRVESIAPASGAVFSLLPPENATGNFTKVVQRVPVRISVPAEVAAEGWLRPGMSVVAVADPRGAPVAH